MLALPRVQDDVEGLECPNVLTPMTETCQAECLVLTSDLFRAIGAVAC